eukprot:gene1882-16146_t
MLDEEFTFDAHVEKVRASVEERTKLLRRVSGTSWGCKRRTVRALYLALVQSVSDFALPAYGPFVPQQKLQPVRELEKEAAMLVGGTVTQTRLTAIYGEADVHPIDRRVKMASANMYERLRRLPEGNPARAMAERDDAAPAKARQPAGWRRVARETVQAAGLADLPREPIPVCG